MQQLMTCDGAMCAALVESLSGMVSSQIGSGVDLEVAAADNTEVVCSKSNHASPRYLGRD